MYLAWDNKMSLKWPFILEAGGYLGEGGEEDFQEACVINIHLSLDYRGLSGYRLLVITVDYKLCSPTVCVGDALG